MEKSKKIKDIAIVSITGYFSIFVSLIKNMFLAYALSIYDYANTQVYTLYVGYAWIFLLGFTDGIYIKYGNLDYNELPMEKMRSFTKILWISQSIIASVLIIFSLFVENTFIGINVAIGIMMSNMVAYYSTINQTTCRFAQDSLSKFIQDFVQLLIMVLIILTDYKSYVMVIVGINISNLIGLMILMKQNYSITFGRMEPFKKNLAEVRELIQVGFFIMISTTMSMLVLSIDKVFVECLLSIEDFANYSFAVSVIMLFYKVISSSAKVVYPYLARIKVEKTSVYYELLSELFIVFGAIACVAYFMLTEIINVFLPKYMASISYMGILFPSVIFKLVFYMVSVNYYKRLNCIKEYTLSGMVVFCISILTNFVGFLLTRKVEGIAYASIFTFMLWYLINDVCFVKKLGVKFNVKKYIFLICTLILFYACVNINSLLRMIIYLVCEMTIMLVCFYKSYKRIIKKIGKDKARDGKL